MLLTGGGSTAMGAMLKGAFGFVFESKRQKHELELARESRANDNFIRLQEQLAQSGNSEHISYSRRIIGFCGIGTYCLCILACTWWPQAEFISITNPTGEGRTEWLFGLLSRIHQPKNRSLSLADTLPLWGKHPFVRFSDFTLARPQEDE